MNRFARRLVVGAFLAMTVMLGCTSKPQTPDSAALCVQVFRQGELRSVDVTDPSAIAALIAQLPAERRIDAALFYFPYGGDIPPGTNTSGNSADSAGRRLYDLYRRQCGYNGP